MKRYVAWVVALAATIAVANSCSKRDDTRRSTGRIIEIPLVEVTKQPVYPDTTSHTEPVVPVTPVTPEPVAQDFGYYVNDTVYNNLNNAKKSFENLFANGKVSTQMKNVGHNLNDGEVRYIDDCMSYMYGLTCDYVGSYQSNNVQGCIDAAKKMCDFDASGFNKGFLFDVMVASKLPWEFNDGTVHVDFDKHYGIYDNQGNIVMTNGRKIHVIGMDDAICTATPEDRDEWSRMERISNWYGTVPKVVTNYYSVVNNTAGNDGICYIWNQTNVEACCRREWSSIKKDGQSMYGFNPETAHVRWDASINSYVFEGPDGEVYGVLGYSEEMRVNDLYNVQDAVINQQGDVYKLDDQIRKMVYQNGFQYTK